MTTLKNNDKKIKTIKTIKTMDETYGDDSNHLCCPYCGFCITCGDCKKYGCGCYKPLKKKCL